MSSHYWSSSNASPGVDGRLANNIGGAGNNITIRGNEIPEGLTSQKPSRNMAEASIKVLRFYRRACRLLPFILRIHNMQMMVTPIAAMRNIAEHIREKSHFRQPTLVDHYVNKAYESLLEAENHHVQNTLLQPLIAPQWKPRGDKGYSYLQKAKYGNKSKFLTTFYQGSKTQDY